MQAETAKKQPFYLAAVLIGIAALMLAGYSRGQLEEAIHRKARALQKAQEQQVQYVRDAETIHFERSWKTFESISSIFSLCCLVCMITAAVRREPGFYSIPLMLFAFSVFIHLLLG